MERLHRSKRLKILLGMVTPLTAYLLSFLLPFLAFILMIAQLEVVSTSEEPPAWFFVSFVAQMMAWLLVLALIVFYTVHPFTGDRVRQDKKAL